MGTRRRLLGVALAVSLTAGLFIGVTAAPATAQAPPEPIIFVHGWNSNTGTWNTMVSRFVSSGFPSNRIYRFGYNTSQSNKTTATQFAAFVDQVRAQTGSPVVDVVSHSMGALPTRWCVKFSGCNGEVDDYVSLAGANHGTIISLCFWEASCREMFPSSSFLADLNRTDETPGTPSYTAVWSDRDGVIVPNSSAQLAGATNLRVSIGHNDFNGSAAIFNLIRPIVVD